MTPLPRRVLQEKIDEGLERALKGDRVTPSDVAQRWLNDHRVRALLPGDGSLCEMLFEYAKQYVRVKLGQRYDANGNRVILSPIKPGNGRAPRGYTGREAMTVAEHIYLGNQQIKTGTKKKTEGTSRLDVSGQALALGKTMNEPIGELAANVRSTEREE